MSNRQRLGTIRVQIFLLRVFAAVSLPRAANVARLEIPEISSSRRDGRTVGVATTFGSFEVAVRLWRGTYVVQ